MMKLVDISDLGSDEFVRGGSSPSIRKIDKKINFFQELVRWPEDLHFVETFWLNHLNNSLQNFHSNFCDIILRVCSLVGRAWSF